MPRAVWLDIGSRVLARHPDAEVRTAVATLALDEVVTRHGLDIEAWRVRDAIESTVYVAVRRAGSSAAGRHLAPPCTVIEHTRFVTARRAIELAALAHVARPWLARADYLTLVSPFVTLIDAGPAAAPRRSTEP